jgi:hypothetical protein
MAPDTYIALIGDLVDSRDLPVDSRHELQARLTAYLAAIPTGEATGAASQPLITLGDEFQALFHGTDPGAHASMALMASVIELARPTSVRFGLGIGPLTTALQEQALGMDGPCFHRARQALDRARGADLLCQLEHEGDAQEVLWSTLAAYATRQRSGWTEPQREAIELYEQLGAWNKVAARLGVSPSAISLRQQAAGWGLYRTAWEALLQGLADIVHRDRGPAKRGGGA